MRNHLSHHFYNLPNRRRLLNPNTQIVLLLRSKGPRSSKSNRKDVVWQVFQGQHIGDEVYTVEFHRKLVVGTITSDLLPGGQKQIKASSYSIVSAGKSITLSDDPQEIWSKPEPREYKLNKIKVTNASSIHKKIALCTMSPNGLHVRPFLLIKIKNGRYESFQMDFQIEAYVALGGFSFKVGQVLDGDASRRLHPVTVPGGEPWSMILGVDRLTTPWYISEKRGSVQLLPHQEYGFRTMDCDHVFKYIIMITFGIVIAIIIWLFNNTAAVNVCAAVAPHAFPAKVEGFAHNLPNQLEPHRLYKILDFIVVLYIYFRFRL